MAPHDLAGLLTPVDTTSFLRTCWGQNFLHVPGARGKFSELLPWPALNGILEQHRMDTPRVRLTRDGKPVPATSYTSYQTNRRRPNQSIPRLRSAELTRELREGATLVLDAVDELHPPITSLAESLEGLFHVRIQVNAYAGWRTSHGFDLHWDDHDVFILQVAGRKDWKVYGMTRKYPMARDVEPTTEKPGTPLWEGMLNDGDLLYIPRGWWHVATPLDEPTLHLTVGVNNPTGSDLLSWFVDRLRASEVVRRDLPLFANPEDQLARLDRLRDLLLSEWSPDVMRQYIADLDSKSQPRTRMNLPWGAMPDVLPPEDGTFRVKWAAARRPVVQRAGSEIHVLANGRRWRFAEAAAPILDRLTSGEICSPSEFQGVAMARTLLRELITNGLAVVVV
ncbi:MAG TPA: cupin domain-containing protein [Bryobacteraceae bacterium]|nr:cupin domain-containing protein [Bryobacteraceae bacterium]